MLRFFFKVNYLTVLIGNHNAKTFGFFHRHRHNRNRNFRAVLLMEIQHYLIIHLVDMVARKNQYILWMKALHICDILINRICSSRIPFAVHTFLIGGKYRNASYISVKVPRNAYSDMGIQAKRLVLC